MMNSLVIFGVTLLALGAAFYASRAAEWLWRKRPGTAGGDAFIYFPNGATHWLAFGGCVVVAVVAFLAAIDCSALSVAGLSDMLWAPLLAG